MSSVLVTRSVACRPMPPVFGGSVIPLSTGLFCTLGGVVPTGTIQANAPVLRLTAVIRLYGGFRMGSPLTDRLLPGPRENFKSDFGSFATDVMPAPDFE